MKVGIVILIGAEAVIWCFALAVWIGRRTTDRMSWHDIWVNTLGVNVFLLALALTVAVVFAVFWMVEERQ